MKKRLLLSVLASFTFISTLYAQEKGKNEISASVGFATSTDLANLFTDIITSGFTGGQITTSNMKTSPSFGITYRHAVADRWMINADGYFQRMSQDLFLAGKSDGKMEYTYITIGLGTDYRYISTNSFQMYSGIAVGYTLENLKYTGNSGNLPDSERFINYHLTAAGFRVGKQFAAFAELGFGYKGIANAGLSYQF
jgi:hypothetical protein